MENVQKSEVEFRSGTSETLDGSDSLQISQKCNIIRVFSVSTSTDFITRLVSLEFCEGYMKDKILFFEKFFKKLGKDFKPSVKELKVPKSTFSVCHEYIKVEIMSRVLVGFGETTENRGRTHTRTEMDMDFLNVCYTKAPSGQK